MSKKAILFLTGLFVALAGLYALTVRRSAPDAAVATTPPREPLLAGWDVNEIDALSIKRGDAVVTRLERLDGQWVVASERNYPADFERVRSALLEMAEVKLDPPIRGATEQLAEFGLEPGGDPEPVSMRLRAGERSEVLWLGEHRRGESGEPGWMPGVGRYVRWDGGPVRLADDGLFSVGRLASEWMQRTLFEIGPDSLAEVTVSRPGEPAYTVTRNEEGQLSLRDAAPGERLDTAQALQLFHALQNLRFIELAEDDLTDEAMGFDQATTYAAQTREGVIYRIQVASDVGHKVGYHMRVDVQAADPEAEEAALLARERFEPWVYVAGAYATRSMTLPRERVLVPPEENDPAGEAVQEEQDEHLQSL